MLTQLTKTNIIWTAIPFETSFLIFDKYRQGVVPSSAPFKLFHLASLPRPAGQQSSREEGKHQLRGPYRKYSFQQKQQAVQRVQNGQDVNSVSKKYGIPRRNLLRWKKNGCQRKEGGGRPTDEQMEKAIFVKIKQGELTEQTQIRQYAAFQSKTSNFKASKGWFLKFRQRYGLKSQAALSEHHSQIGVDIQSTDSHLN